MLISFVFKHCLFPGEEVRSNQKTEQGSTSDEGIHLKFHLFKIPFRFCTKQRY